MCYDLSVEAGETTLFFSGTDLNSTIHYLDVTYECPCLGRNDIFRLHTDTPACIKRDFRKPSRSGLKRPEAMEPGADKIFILG